MEKGCGLLGHGLSSATTSCRARARASAPLRMFLLSLLSMVAPTRAHSRASAFRDYLRIGRSDRPLRPSP